MNNYNLPPRDEPYWIGGKANPDEFLGPMTPWYIWKVHSDEPCQACRDLDGNISPRKLEKWHLGCNCTQEFHSWGGCKLDRREARDAVNDDHIEYLGTLPPGGMVRYDDLNSESSSSSFSASAGAPAFSFSNSSTEGSSSSGGTARFYTNNGDEDVAVYAHWKVEKVKYIDHYLCGQGGITGTKPRKPHTVDVYKITIRLDKIGPA